MMRVLTEEESEESSREMDEWILALPFNFKAKFRQLVEEIENPVEKHVDKKFTQKLIVGEVKAPEYHLTHN